MTWYGVACQFLYKHTDKTTLLDITRFSAPICPTSIPTEYLWEHGSKQSACIPEVKYRLRKAYSVCGLFHSKTKFGNAGVWRQGDTLCNVASGTTEFFFYESERPDVNGSGPRNDNVPSKDPSSFLKHAAELFNAHMKEAVEINNRQKMNHSMDMWFDIPTIYYNVY